MVEIQEPNPVHQSDEERADLKNHPWMSKFEEIHKIWSEEHWNLREELKEARKKSESENQIGIRKPRSQKCKKSKSEIKESKSKRKESNSEAENLESKSESKRNPETMITINLDQWAKKLDQGSKNRENAEN